MMTEQQIIQAIALQAELTLEAAGRAYKAFQNIMRQSLEQEMVVTKVNKPVAVDFDNRKKQFSMA